MPTNTTAPVAYAVKHSHGLTERHGTYDTAIAALQSVYGDDIEVEGDEYDLAHRQTNRALVWQTEELSRNDDGARACATITALWPPDGTVYYVGNPHEGMPAAGGEILATSATEAAEIYVAGGDWGDPEAAQITVAVAVRDADGDLDRDNAVTVTVDVAYARARHC